MPTINVRWSDNTAELRARLREGIGALDAMKSSVEKTVQAMGGQGLFRAANNVTAAIIQMGGATKLTAAEQQRHLVLLDKAIEKYRVMGQTVPPILQNIADQMRKTNQPLSAMVSGMTAAGKTSVESARLIAGMSASGQSAMTALAASTVKVQGPFTSMLGIARQLGPALGIGFGVSAVVGFGKAILDDADALVKMHDKTGISLQGLQKFQIAADDAGNSLDQLTMATNQMQNRIAGNDASAVAALQKLGLNLAAIKAMAPEDQFMAIADAIRGIKDPAEQVNVAMDIFGRSGAEILPTIKRGFDDIRDAAVGMSDETVKALDDAGDAWDRWWRKTKGTAAGGAAFVTNMITGATTAREITNRLNLAAATPLTPLQQAELGAPRPTAPFSVGVPGVPTDLAEITKSLGSQLALKQAVTAEEQKAAAVAKAAAEAAARERAAAWDDIQRRQLERVSEGGGFIFGGGLSNAFRRQADAQRFLNQQTTGATQLRGTTLPPGTIPTGFVPGQGAQSLSALFDMGKIEPPDMSDLVKTFRMKFTDAAKSIAASMNDIFQRAFEGGGAIKGAIQSMATSIVAGLTSLIPVIGPMVSKFAGAIVAGFTKLFGGPSKEEREGRDVKKTFQDSFGSFDKMLGAINDAYLATGRTSEQARQDVLRLIAAEKEGAEAVKRVIAEINVAFEEQKTRWEGVQESVADLNAFVKDGVGELGRYNIASGSAVAIFDAWVKKTGDVAGALQQIGPALDAIATAQTDMGFAGNAAINQLLGLRKVTEANPVLMAQIGESTRLLTSLGKAGLLTEELLVSFGQNAVNQFTVLKSKTGDARSAMVLMQPELQALWEHQQKFGKFADEATEALVNQAKEAGLVGPDMKSDQDKLLDVMKEIRDTLREIAGITIPDQDVTVDYHYNDPGPPDVSGPEVYASTGGRVTTHGIQRFALGGIVQPQRLALGGIVQSLRPPQYLAAGGFASMQTLFPSRGTDTQLIMATPGELILNQSQQQGLAGALDNRAVVAAIERLRAEVRAASVTGDTVVQIDGREIARATVKAWDNGTSITEAREVLGVR